MISDLLFLFWYLVDTKQLKSGCQIFLFPIQFGASYLTTLAECKRETKIVKLRLPPPSSSFLLPFDVLVHNRVSSQVAQDHYFDTQHIQHHKCLIFYMICCVLLCVIGILACFECCYNLLISLTTNTNQPKYENQWKTS